MNTPTIINVIALIVIIIAIILLGKEIKLVHLILFTSGIIFFGFRLFKNYRNE